MSNCNCTENDCDQVYGCIISNEGIHFFVTSYFILYLQFTYIDLILSFGLNYKAKTLTYSIYNMLACQNTLASIIEN